MAISLPITQTNGVVTTYHTLLELRCQPQQSLQVYVGSYLDQATRLAGGSPVITTYIPLDITALDLTQAIPAQLYAQLMAPGSMFFGGTIC